MLVGADPDAVSVAPGDFPRDALRHPPEGVVERIALVAMVEGEASPVIGRPDREDEPLAGRHGPIDGLDGLPGRWPPLSGRVDELAEGGPHRADVAQGAIRRRTRDLECLEGGLARVMDDATLAQPVDPVARRAEDVDRDAVVVLERVEELKGVVYGQMMIVGIHWSRIHVTNI